MSISSVDLGFKNTHILSSRHLRSRRLDLPPDRAGSVGLLPPVFSSFISQQRLRKYIVSYATCAVLPPEQIWTAQASILRHLKLEKRLLHPRRCVSSRRHPPLEHTSELWVPLDCLLPCILYSPAEIHRDSSLDNIGACVLELGGQFRITTQDATTAARWFRPVLKSAGTLGTTSDRHSVYGVRLLHILTSNIIQLSALLPTFKCW